MRYGGNYKSYGPQYVRGILEGNGTPCDGNMWLSYSVNKEDIWVSKVNVPLKAKALNHVNDVFNDMESGKELNDWNIYSPVWAKVKISKQDAVRALRISDKDSMDYTKAERLFPASENVSVSFTISAAQKTHGTLNMELQDAKGSAAMRLTLDADGYLKYKDGYRVKNIMAYDANNDYNIRIEARCDNRLYEVFVNDKSVKRGLFFAPVHSLERLVFRSGDVRHFPTIDTPTDQNYDLRQTGLPAPESVYFIKSVHTKKL